MEDRDTDYLRGLVETLRSRDPERLRAYLRTSAEERDPDRVEEIDAISGSELEVRMHKMILARPDLQDLHADSRRWLTEHGQRVSF